MRESAVSGGTKGVHEGARRETARRRPRVPESEERLEQSPAHCQQGGTGCFPFDSGCPRGERPDSSKSLADACYGRGSGHLFGARVFFSLDCFKGHWQFLLAHACQEYFSFLTDEGVFTPTRVLMGGSDSVAYCQRTVQEMFHDVLYNGLLVWLDDLLGYEKTEAGLLTLLRKVLERCKDKGLKLNPKKCTFYQTEALRCGKVVSAEGIQHNPAQVSALQDLPPPGTGADLLQCVCAVNWMRLSIPAHNRIVEPLRQALERVYQSAQGRTKRKAAGVLLSNTGWGEKEEALSAVVALAHRDSTNTLWVFADASEEHWGAVVTQFPAEHSLRLLEEQDHQPLMFLSGTFSGAAKKWAIVEKEAFALVETCKRADYLLHSGSGFQLFTDHRLGRPGSARAGTLDPLEVGGVLGSIQERLHQRWWEQRIGLLGTHAPGTRQNSVNVVVEEETGGHGDRAFRFRDCGRDHGSGCARVAGCDGHWCRGSWELVEEIHQDRREGLERVLEERARGHEGLDGGGEERGAVQVAARTKRIIW